MKQQTIASERVEPAISATTDEKESHFLLEKRTNMLYQRFLPGAVSTLLVSTLFILTMWERAEASVLLWWLTVVWIITLLRGLLVRRFFQLKPDVEQLRQWITLFIAGAVAAGGVWGLAAFLFVSGADDMTTMLVAFFIAGISAASTVMFAPVLFFVAAFLLPALVPLSIRLLSFAEGTYWFMGSAVMVYLAVLLIASWYSYRELWSTVRIGIAKDRLKKDFIAEKALAEDREETLARLMVLERENELFRNMIERTTNFSVLVHDLVDQGKIIYANDAARNHFGVDKATLLNWTPSDFDPHCNAMLLEKLFNKMKVGESIIFESEHRVQDGKLIPVEVILHPLEQDDRLLGVSYIRDIRQRREREAQRRDYEAAIARQEVEKQYRTLVETLPDFIAHFDTQAKYTYINPSMLQATGREENAFLGRTAIEVGFTGTLASDRRLYEETLRAVESGEVNIYQDWVMLAGHRVCFDIRHIPKRDVAGNVVSVLVIWRDITEQVKMNDTLKFIAQRGWSSDGEPFLTALARYIGKTLEIDYVIIDRLNDDQTEAETIAIFERGNILPNIRYPLKGTPCEHVMNGEFCCYPRDIQQCFPEDLMLVDLHVESYIGLPLWDSAGQVIGLISVMDERPIVDEAAVMGLLQLVATRVAAELERECSERVLKSQEHEYRHLLDNSPDAIIRYDSECRRMYSNAAHRKILTTPVVIGTTPIEAWGLPSGKEEAENYQACLQKVLDSGMPDEWELAWHDADGKFICFLLRGTPEFDQYGKVVGVQVFGRDISVRKQLEAATLAREQEFRALVENSPDSISRFDRQGRRSYINPIFARNFGEKGLLGKTLSEIYPGYAPAQDYEMRLQRVLELGEKEQFVFTLTQDDGRHYFYDMQLVPERDESGQIISVLSIGRDISERLHLEEKLRRQASFDALTGLPNRWLFGERLREEIDKAERGGGHMVLLFIDLDRFKEINDTLGHEIGDQLLVEAARRIQLCMHKSDIVARLGSDEFVVCLPMVTETVYIGGIAQKIINALNQPFTLNDNLAYVTASVGIASYPCDANNADALLSCADQAMYAAKEQGRNCHRFFTSSMQEQAERRIRLANDMRAALTKQEFQLHFQPILDTVTGQVVKTEALLRWRHPEHGMVPPDQFIPIAEDTGLIHEIGDWVFRESVKMAAQLRGLCNGASIQVSVNISPRQFMHAQTVSSLLGYMALMGVPGKCIVVEITEGLLLDDQDDVKHKLSRLRDEAGISVALDDFGTGYSAMSYLKKFNIDYLKIDRSFVRDLAVDESDRAIAETIVIMAKRLGMKTIAEGVETIEQRDILAAVGCEYVQGYLYSRPIPADEFLEYVVANGRLSS